jgi:hypothetical protein
LVASIVAASTAKPATAQARNSGSFSKSPRFFDLHVAQGLGSEIKPLRVGSREWNSKTAALYMVGRSKNRLPLGTEADARDVRKNTLAGSLDRLLGDTVK